MRSEALTMAESISSRLSRLLFNLFPAYFGTGARITHIESNWRHVRLQLPLSVRTRNYVGTIFGGSMYGAVDPIYMLMLIKNLGPDYVVWDKSATIRFKRPGRTTLHADFTIEQVELDMIRSELVSRTSVERVYAVDLLDNNSVVHAHVEKTLHIRRAPVHSPRSADRRPPPTDH